MIDNNIRTDYNKLRHLIRLEQENGHERLYHPRHRDEWRDHSTIKTAFPAEDLAKPDNFKSLLYYFGLLTIRVLNGGVPYWRSLT